ncbi:MAG: GntP family permease [Bacteroidota bacterium]|nr:GntP family permease [Bacteroidota bacterium]
MTLLIVLGAIILLFILTINKVNPFLAILAVAIGCGFALSMPATQILKSIEQGVGSTLGSVVLILWMGVILGKFLEKSGAAQVISVALIRLFGVRNIHWAILCTGFVVGIPLFYNAGFILLIPLVFSIHRTSGKPLLWIAIPMAASLSITHAFLPPHPGPATLSSMLGASISEVLIYGFILAVPLALIAGIFFPKFLNPAIASVELPISSVKEIDHIEDPPSLGTALLFTLLPVGLIATPAILSLVNMQKEGFGALLYFLGDSFIALFITVCFVCLYLGIRKKRKVSRMMPWVVEAMESIAMIVAIIAAGGIFKQILIDSQAAEEIKNLMTNLHIHPLIAGWLIAAILRVTLGSATIAGITAAGMVLPLTVSTSVSPELMVLSVGAGSIFFSHVNDTGFWMFKEFLHLSVRQTLLSWSLMETIISLLGLSGVLILNTFVG